MLPRIRINNLRLARTLPSSPLSEEMIDGIQHSIKPEINVFAINGEMDNAHERPHELLDRKRKSHSPRSLRILLLLTKAAPEFPTVIEPVGFVNCPD